MEYSKYLGCSQSVVAKIRWDYMRNETVERTENILRDYERHLSNGIWKSKQYALKIENLQQKNEKNWVEVAGSFCVNTEVNQVNKTGFTVRKSKQKILAKKQYKILLTIRDVSSFFPMLI